MRVTFFTAVMNIEIGSIPGRGDQISDRIFVTTDKDILRDLLTPQTLEAIGGLEHSFLQTAPAIIYSQKEASEEFEWFDYLGGCLREVKTFFNVMWLGKDNAADSELGFLTYARRLVQSTHSSSIAARYVMADGSRSVISFSRKELQEIRAFYRAWLAAAQIVDVRSYDMLEPDDTGRTMRAFYWIQAGRSASGMGERVACFCTAMESLFASSSSELAHQLAERMAVFVSADPQERKSIYRQVKRAYNVRSKIVHGDAFKREKSDQIRTVSLECDELLRRAFQKSISDNEAYSALEGDNDGLDQYFLQLLFSS